jgi:hypothetical protein
MSPFALKQTQQIFPIASPMATIGINICLKPSGGGGGGADAATLSSTRRAF